MVLNNPDLGAIDIMAGVCCIAPAIVVLFIIAIARLKGRKE